MKADVLRKIKTAPDLKSKLVEKMIQSPRFVTPIKSDSAEYKSFLIHDPVRYYHFIKINNIYKL